MNNIIRGHFGTALHPAINSYEEALRAKIKLHQWRADGYQDSGDFETAGLEIAFADGLIKALHMYQSWGLD